MNFIDIKMHGTAILKIKNGSSCFRRLGNGVFERCCGILHIYSQIPAQYLKLETYPFLPNPFKFISH